ncbi:LptF/LptG family permease [Abyssalbus ytuae]|uniref:LptF/LptG family permease n=1 Tax=Abyssalbus ytuae TaxID=2926907 RepID=A0A9E6ZV05_9FLAO|nr:LptF/LptG family permease [Abyssalbus ytuae]UOB18283.1 LptF/LptG family permease [Abyssalbus ytuae]
MKIIDWYILKRYLITFFVMILMFVPIGILINLAEKIDKMKEREAPLDEILIYYLDFTFYFANLLFPIFLFLSIIWFTSKLANNSEVIAVLSSGISFMRFLRPYIIGATIIAIIAFVMGMFIVPAASKGYNEFNYKYLSRKKVIQTENIFNQLDDNDFIYVSSFEPKSKIGYDFTYEHFEDNKLKWKIFARNIRWVEKDSIYRLSSYTKRIVGEKNDIIESERRFDTIFSFKIEDLSPVSYVAETKNLFELNEFIKNEQRKGSPNIKRFMVVKYKRWALPVTAFILTIIAVAVSSKKRRGGMGVNLAVGVTLAFLYIFFDKVFGTLAQQTGFSPLMSVILPNLFFGVLALYLLNNAKR